MTWVRPTIKRNEDGTFEAAEWANLNHVADHAIALANEVGKPITLSYGGKVYVVPVGADPVALRDELAKPAAEPKPAAKKAPAATEAQIARLHQVKPKPGKRSAPPAKKAPAPVKKAKVKAKKPRSPKRKK